MAGNRLHDASWNLVDSVREANQTVANTLVAVLDRHLKFAYLFYLSSVIQMTSNTSNTSVQTGEYLNGVQPYRGF